MNSRCKYYWEDNCMNNIEEKRIEIDENGKCETFEEGKSDWYKFECLICERPLCEEPGDICNGCYPEFKEDMEESN